MILEAKIFGRLWESVDRQEGLQAFVEKRKPDFRGR